MIIPVPIFIEDFGPMDPLASMIFGIFIIIWSIVVYLPDIIQFFSKAEREDRSLARHEKKQKKELRKLKDRMLDEYLKRFKEINEELHNSMPESKK